MRVCPRALLGLCIAAAMLPVKAAAQNDTGDQSGWLFGYLDPRTDIFTAEAPAGDATAAEANIGGTLRIEVTFQIRSAIPPDATFSGYAMIGVRSGRNSGNVARAAKITRSGDVGKAVVMLRYLFLATQPANMNVWVSVGANRGGGPSFRLTRNVPLPADGASTVMKIDASL